MYRQCWGYGSYKIQCGHYKNCDCSAWGCLCFFYKFLMLVEIVESEDNISEAICTANLLLTATPNLYYSER